jgi:glycosyltransferase involved in cell wall biosynthesis
MCKKEVFHFILDHRYGGPHAYISTLKQGLGFEYSHIVYTTSRGRISDRSLLNLRHFWAPLYLFEVLLNLIFLTGKFLPYKLRRKKFVFHVHGGANIGPIIVAVLLKIPILWHIHETTSAYKRLIILSSWLLKRSRSITAVVAKSSRSSYGLLDPVYLPGGVDRSFWSLEGSNFSVAKSTDITKNNRLKLVSIGNLNPLKGSDILINAVSKLKFPFDLKIVGAELSTHAQFASEIKIKAYNFNNNQSDSYIEFLGFKTESEIRDLLSSSDIFVMPSRSEACPIALLEAISIGLYVVASDVGDISLILSHYSDSEIFESGDAKKCALGIENARDIVFDPNYKKGSSPFPQMYDMHEMVKNVRHQYKTLLQ